MKFNLKNIRMLEFLLALGMLIFSVWFNLRLYHLEPTAKVDPNDNSFQFALVDRANTVWSFAKRHCPPGIFGIACVTNDLIDHWVPNWAQGYNLPFYYSHMPQIVIVGSWRMLSGVLGGMTLFAFYHWIIYFLLCFFPVVVFVALRAAGLPWLTAGIGAVLSTQLSTDGLYGLDPPSFLWRGYGLSSQLFSMIWLPLAIGFTYRFYNLPEPETGMLPDHPGARDIARRTMRELTDTVLPHSADKTRLRNFWIAVAFLIVTTAGHLGIGVMALLSAAVIAYTRPVEDFLRQRRFQEFWTGIITSTIRLGFLGAATVFFLAYWILPVLLYNNYHNISVWDPIWKFNSYGWKETMIRFFNGDLFDFGRVPAFTVLTLIGMVAATGVVFPLRELISGSTQNSRTEQDTDERRPPLFAFTLLFVFWMLLYFGRTTWGGLINLIPGMTEFHISRFIVGVHAIGLFLAPIGVASLGSAVAFLLFRFFSTRKKLAYADMPPYIAWIVTLVVLFLFARPIYRQTVYYNELNDKLIVQGNNNFDKVDANIQALFAKLRTLPPARVFAGRGGGWGKDFRVAETPMYMYISAYGINTALWLPETWSMNSDTEQYFSEDKAKDYDLYNLKWIAAPPDQKPQPFWKKLAENPFWTLYESPTTGYFTLGTRTQAVVAKKTDLINIVRLWIQSDAHKNGLFPQIAYKDSEVVPDVNVPVIRMTDEVSYRSASGDLLNIFAANPIYAGDKPNAELLGPEKDDTDQLFSTTVKVGQGCTECYLILKQTFHPDWRATVNGQTVKPIAVFPFFVGIPLDHPGVVEVKVWYAPHPWKLPLLTLSLLTAVGLLLSPVIYKKMKTGKARV